MRVVSQQLPDTSSTGLSASKRTDLARKLESLENIFTSSAKVKIASSLRLNSDDTEAICRIYKTVPVVVEGEAVNASATMENLISSNYWDSILRPYTLLLSLDGLSYSSWHYITQIHEPRFSCLTSLFMLAARERHEVPYMYWKRGLSRNDWMFLFDRNVVTALTSPNTPSVAQWDRIKPNATMYQYVLKDPTNPLGYFLAPVPEINDEIEDDEGGPKLLWEGFNKWPKIIQHMKLQTWVCHPSVRDENSMLLHPFNWDFVPPTNNFAPKRERQEPARIEKSQYASFLTKRK